MKTCRVFVLFALFFSICSCGPKPGDTGDDRLSIAPQPETEVSSVQDDQKGDEKKSILRANTLCEEKEYKKAVEIYQELLEEFNSADAAYNLGLTYETNLNKPSMALLYYSKFLSLESDSPDAEVVRSWIRRIQAAKTSLSVKPSMQEKKQSVQEVSESLPTLRSPEKQVLPERDLIASAIIREEDISSEKVGIAKSFLRTGLEHSFKGRYQEAIEDYLHVLDYYDSADAYYNIGVTYHRKLQLPEYAILFYRRYLKLDSFSETAKEVRKLLDKAETTLLMEKLLKEEQRKQKKKESLMIPSE